MRLTSLLRVTIPRLSAGTFRAEFDIRGVASEQWVAKGSRDAADVGRWAQGDFGHRHAASGCRPVDRRAVLLSLSGVMTSVGVLNGEQTIHK